MADELRKVNGLVVDANSPYTNMVYFNLSQEVSLNAQQVTEKMKNLGVLVDPENAHRFRLVTHYWIDDEAVEKTVSAFQEVLN
jgi:threonine aldolase